MDVYSGGNQQGYQQPQNQPPYYQTVQVQPCKRPLSFWVAIVLGIFLFLSFIFNVLLLSAVVSTAAVRNTHNMQEDFIAGDAGSQNKIVVIDISGVIMNEEAGGLLFSSTDMVTKVSTELSYAEEDDCVKAVILRVNSPGGAITACDTIYDQIKRFRKKRPDVKVTAFYETVSASGGYYVTAGADKIIASPTCITGSIGVIMSFYNLEELYQKIGLKDVIIKSGQFKDIGSPSRPMTDKENELFREMLNEMYQRFLAVVDEGRKNLDMDKVKELADGRVFTGEQAKLNGLVDETGYFEDAIETTEKIAGISGAKVIKYGKIPSFIDVLFGASGRQEQFDVATELHKLFLAKTPVMMYMYRME